MLSGVKEVMGEGFEKGNYRMIFTVKMVSTGFSRRHRDDGICHKTIDGRGDGSLVCNT